MRHHNGFTLVELLIVVALIGLLATLAITQLEAYRQKGYNSAALSDLISLKQVLEAHYTEYHRYPLF